MGNCLFLRMIFFFFNVDFSQLHVYIPIFVTAKTQDVIF